MTISKGPSRVHKFCVAVNAIDANVSWFIIVKITC